MKQRKFMSDTSNIWSKNKLMGFVIFCLTVCLAVSVYYNVLLSSTVRTVIIPLGTTSEMTIDSEKVDENYLKSIGAFLAYSLYTFTDANVVEHYTGLKSMFEDGNLANEVIKLAKTYQEKHINYSNLVISEIDYRKGEVIVTGNLEQKINDIPVRNERMAFVVGYKVKYGRFFITSYQEVKAKN